MTIYPTLDAYLPLLDLSELTGSKPDEPYFIALAGILQWPEAVAATVADPQMVLQRLGIQAGDYLILPNLSPPPWATAARALGADIILIDHQPGHWQLDLDLLEEFLMNYTMLNERDELILKKDSRIVRALIVPHLLGGLCDLERLAFIARRFSLAWGEDISRALGSRWKDRPAGTYGQLNYYDPAYSPILPFGSPVAFSSDPIFRSRLPIRAAAGNPSAELANRLAGQLAPKVPAILQALRQVESAYRQREALAALQWLEPAADCTGNGLAAAFTTDRPDLRAADWLGRLPPPLYQRPPFDKSLYIRREDIAWKLYDSARILPVSLQAPPPMDQIVERLQ